MKRLKRVICCIIAVAIFVTCNSQSITLNAASATYNVPSQVVNLNNTNDFFDYNFDHLDSINSAHAYMPSRKGSGNYGITTTIINTCGTTENMRVCISENGKFSYKQYITMSPGQTVQLFWDNLSPNSVYYFFLISDTSNPNSRVTGMIYVN